MKLQRVVAVVSCLLVVSSFVGSPVMAANSNGLDDRVRDAIVDGRQHLVEQQRGDHWVADSRYRNVSRPRNVMLTINYGLALELTDGSESSQRRAIEFVLSERPDDGWNDSETAYGAALLLREANSSRYESELAAIEENIDRRNLTLGQFEGESPFLQPGFLIRVYYVHLSDRLEREDLFGQRSGTVRNVSAALGMTPALEDGFDANRSFTVPDSVAITGANLVFASEAYAGNQSRAEDVRDLGRALLFGRQTNDGTWELLQVSVHSLAALGMLGYTVENDSVAAGVDALSERQTESGRIPPFHLSATDTADALRALRAAGLGPGDRPYDEGAQWLLDARTTGYNGTNPPPALMFRNNTGVGWGLRSSVYTDWDDTAVAITSLSDYDDSVVARDVEFLFRVQNRDGSWATYTKDYSPFNETERRFVQHRLSPTVYQSLFVDPPAPGVSGHALEALGEQGYTVENNQSVREARDYFLNHTSRNGLWGGVWAFKYTYGTSAMLVGFQKTGVDMDRPGVTRAVDGLVAHQNADGGWGERWSASQADRQAWASSRPTQTAWGLQALLAAETPTENESVRAAVEYLLQKQRENGAWEPQMSLAVGGGVPTYEDAVVTQSAILYALSMYADAAGMDLPDYGERADDVLPVETPTTIWVAVAALGWLLFVAARRGE